MTECLLEPKINFYEAHRIEVKFSEQQLSTDAGILLVRQAEEKVKIIAGMSERIADERDPNKITHSMKQLVTQRVLQLANGYEDAIDSNSMRHDPILKIACGRVPTSGEELLASQPTMTRLENQVSKQENGAIRRLYVERFIEQHKTAPEEIVLDIDGWDAETYGNQQMSFFHGYYGHHMYYPVLINESKSGYPLVLQLRAGNSHAGKGVAGILRWIFWRLRRAWAGVKIILRGDGGFSLPEILKVCEHSRVGYIIGFSSNNVLKRKVANLLERARLQYCQTGEKARLFDDVYYAAASWSQPRRLVMKAEWLEKGSNPRFVITNLDLPPQELYDRFYVQRGADSEHRIKELKLGIKAGRLSCHRFEANQFRLLLAQAAYTLLLIIRQAASATKLRNAQVQRLRDALLKCAAHVKISVRRVLVQLPTFFPFAQEISLILNRLSDPNFMLFD
ncbi:MAG: IS1380 family transposase [Pseudanabaena sp. SU_2_4]|nr:IS1380 family transposase [Pseudanabaena sp. SU_2_4]NKB17325.1 IS1380 family transposase [Pseudanabaena sp. CRU_2_10]